MHIKSWMKGTWDKLYRLYLRYAINTKRGEAVFSHHIFKFFFLLLTVGDYSTNSRQFFFFLIIWLLTDIVSNQ